MTGFTVLCNFRMRKLYRTNQGYANISLYFSKPLFSNKICLLTFHCVLCYVGKINALLLHSFKPMLDCWIQMDFYFSASLDVKFRQDNISHMC